MKLPRLFDSGKHRLSEAIQRRCKLGGCADDVIYAASMPVWLTLALTRSGHVKPSFGSPGFPSPGPFGNGGGPSSWGSG
ncbi:hypothetical protein BDV40DRAFT_256767 [Aspergillus tamarii]|uniref:Uncharacterized protein n=1 Tax=Aspergillus tamarii TaxID=41984 RepID=A0A5N6V5L5_ASPTM|nr:hypothetical protein BDV40DRAFT_256767 [Aspergillus tamarii]